MKPTITLLFLAILLIACAPATPPPPTVDAEATQAAMVKTLVAASNQTSTALAPTATKLPTDTPVPTPTSTPEPKPITLTGTGDGVVDLQKPFDAAILKITYTGGSNFIVRNYDGGGNAMDVLVNEIGSYSGILPLDFIQGEETARFEVKASGPWELQVSPLSYAKGFAAPGTITGSGSDVIAIIEGDPDLLKINASKASGNFIVRRYGGNTGRVLLVNEIAPYTGAIVSGGDHFILSIIATGEWSIEVTSK